MNRTDDSTKKTTGEFKTWTPFMEWAKYGEEGNGGPLKKF